MAINPSTEIIHPELGPIRFDDGKPLPGVVEAKTEPRWVSRPDGWDSDLEIYLPGDSHAPTNLDRAIAAFRHREQIEAEGGKLSNSNVYFVGLSGTWSRRRRNSRKMVHLMNAKMIKFRFLIALCCILLVYMFAPPANGQLFAPPITVIPGAYPTSAVAVDVDRDGWLDLVVAIHSSDFSGTNFLHVLTNDRLGGFVLSGSLEVGTAPFSLVAPDLNGDDLPDLVDADLLANTLTVLTNTGYGDFKLRTKIGGGNRPISVAPADVNGDSKTDLICANQGNNTLNVLTNDGTAGFVLSATHNVGAQPSCVVAADLSGDGKADLISANTLNDTLTVLTNDGGGAFSFSATLSVGSRPRFVVAPDVNGDGSCDLVCANKGPSGLPQKTLSVLTNDQTANFLLSSTLTVQRAPTYILAADINRDGKSDLISVNYESDSLTLLTNDGSGGFATNSILNTGSEPYHVLAADFNRDGALDLVSVNYGGATLSLFLGVPPPNVSIKHTSSNVAIISWPSPSTGFILQTNNMNVGGNWGDLLMTPLDDGTNKSIIMNLLTDRLFFRLKQ